jgi:hypothetical protein
MTDHWNRCDVCGRFIAYDDFDNGATRQMLTPDSHFSSEDWETLCVEHSETPQGAGRAVKSGDE